MTLGRQWVTRSAHVRAWGWGARRPNGRAGVSVVGAVLAALWLAAASPAASAAASSGGGKLVHAASGNVGSASAPQAVHGASFSVPGWGSLTGGGILFEGAACPSIFACYVAGFASGPTAVVWANNGQAGDGTQWTRQVAVAGFFDDMACAGATTDCVAVGGKGNPVTGLVYYTPDGLVWSAGTLPAGTGELGWVKCVPNGPPDPNVPTGYCWAVSADGRSGYRSIDGGKTWSAIPLPQQTAGGQAIVNNDVAFVSTTIGWIVGFSGCANFFAAGCRGVVSMTTNGGDSWTLQPTPANMSALDNISCPTATECLAVGTNSRSATGYLTFDAGRHWQATSLPYGMGYANGVACPDGNHCYVSGFSGPGTNPSGAVMFATANAGRSWQLQPVRGGSNGAVDVACASATMCYGAGQSRQGATISITTNGGVPWQGYWSVASDGGVFSFNAAFQGSTGAVRLAKPVVGMATNRATGGYWLAASDGGVFSFNAPFYGSTGAIRLAKPVVGVTAATDGYGYYLVASDGGVFAYGDAKFQGSTGAVPLVKPVVGMAIDPGTNGYRLVASDGGVFSFNAPFYGSTGGIRLVKPVVGMAADPATGGYWLVASDGGVFSFNAPFYGSTGAVHLTQPIVGIQATPDGKGYWLVAADGGIFTFGDAKFYGSTGGVNLTKPIVGMTSAY
jgi:hypothetical protein